MKKFKFLISLSSLSLLAMPLMTINTSCSHTDYNETEVPVLMSETTALLKTKIMFKNNSSVAYISLDNALKMVQQLHLSVVYDTKFDYTITKSNGIYSVKRENGATLDIYPSSGKLIFSDFSKFVSNGCSRISDIAQDEGGFEPSTSQNVKFVAYGSKDIRWHLTDKKEINLSDYGISLIPWNDTIYFPLQTISDLFLNAIYCPVFAIKNAIIPVGTLPAGEIGVKTEFKPYIANNKLELNQELLDFNYNETCLWLDLDYGLKNKKSIQSFDQIFKGNSYDGKRSLKECMVSSPEEYDKAIDYVFANIFDDGHSGYVDENIYNSDVYTRSRGMSSVERMRYYLHYYLLRDEVWEDDTFPQYLEVESSKATAGAPDFAYITFDTFTSIDKNFTKEDIPADPKDAPRNNGLALFTSAYAKISKSSSIKNVVVDISNNGGGDGTFCVWLASLLAGGEISVTFRNTSDDTINTCSYYADANLDGKIDYDDMAFAEKKIYILTSPVSFSCANLLPSILKPFNNIKIIGQKTDGGACVVHKGVNALGTATQISGPCELGYIHSGTFFDIDEGIEPLYYIDSSKYYGPVGTPRQDLTKLIANY